MIHFCLSILYSFAFSWSKFQKETHSLLRSYPWSFSGKASPVVVMWDSVASSSNGDSAMGCLRKIRDKTVRESVFLSEICTNWRQKNGEGKGKSESRGSPECLIWGVKFISVWLNRRSRWMEVHGSQSIINFLSYSVHISWQCLPSVKTAKYHVLAKFEANQHYFENKEGHTTFLALEFHKIEF